MINPDILSTKAFGLVLSISVVGEMILSLLLRKSNFKKRSSLLRSKSRQEL